MRFRITPSVAFLAAVLAARADDYRRASLFERAPFGDATKTGSTPGAYELRGFFGHDGDVRVSIRKTDTGVSRWIRVGEKSGDLVVEEADAEEGVATLVAGGLRLSLKLATESAGNPGGRDEEAPTGALAVRPESLAIARRKSADADRRRETAFATLRAAHPEYFIEPNRMDDTTRREAAAAIDAVNRRLASERDGYDEGR